MKLLKESDKIGEKRADFEWNGKLWELKTTSTTNATDSALRKGLKQIAENPGGIILDYGSNTVNLDELEVVIESRLKRSGVDNIDVMIVKDNEMLIAFRHKK